MKKKISAILIAAFSLSGCFSENTDSAAVTSADFSTTGVETVEEALSEDEEATTGIPANLIMLDGVIYHIDSITPTDYVVFTDGEYISVCHGGASEFSELFLEENYIADIIRTESTPQADFESDFYLTRGFIRTVKAPYCLRNIPNMPSMCRFMKA